MEGSVGFEDGVVEGRGMVLVVVAVVGAEGEEGFIEGIGGSLVRMEGCLIDSVGRDLHDTLRDLTTALLLVR